MNRNSLLAVSKKILDDNKDFKAPEECKFNLSGKPLREKMIKALEKLYNEKVIRDHGIEVGKELANVLSGGEEVILQSNFVVSHTNIVMGLVETIVGLVPAGGGCKEVLWRWC